MDSHPSAGFDGLVPSTGTVGSFDPLVVEPSSFSDRLSSMVYSFARFWSWNFLQVTSCELDLGLHRFYFLSCSVFPMETHAPTTSSAFGTAGSGSDKGFPSPNKFAEEVSKFRMEMVASSVLPQVFLKKFLEYPETLPNFPVVKCAYSFSNQFDFYAVVFSNHRSGDTKSADHLATGLCSLSCRGRRTLVQSIRTS